MPWTILTSSVLRAAGYDPARRVLTVRFVTGRVYRYSAVPLEVVAGLLDPEHGSHGRFFNEEIRDRYDHEDITDG